MMPMKHPPARLWQVKRLSNSLGDQAEAWDALNQALYEGHPMLDSRFVNGLLKHFGNGSEHLCVLTSNGTPEAMCLLRSKGLGKWVTFLPSQAQIGLVLIKRFDDLYGLFRSLPGFAVRLDILCNDPAYIDLPSTDSTTSKITNHALTMAINLDGGFENYWLSRSKKLIQNIGRYERRLDDDGLFRKFLQIGAPDDISAAIARYAELESKGWKATLGTAVNLNDSQGAFYSSLMSSLAKHGGAKAFELWFDDQLVASRLAIEAGEMIVMLKTTYDETYSKYSPGRLLLHRVIQSLFITHPGKVIEFYTDADADQLTWATAHRWIKHASLYRSESANKAFQQAKRLAKIFTAKNKSNLTEEIHHTICVYRHPDEFPLKVNEFFARADSTNVECSTHWYRNLVNTVFAADGGVRFYVLLQHNSPVAALPIIVRKGLLGNSVEALGNYYTTLYSPLLAPQANEHHLVHLISAVRSDNTPISSWRFSPMNRESNGYSTLSAALRASGLAPFDFFCFGNWYQSVNDDWPTYLKEREGTVRSTIKRMKKKFVAEGGTLELILGGADLDRGLAAYQHVYASSWKRAEPFPEFVPGLIGVCAEQGWLRLGIAWLAREPIAAQIWIVAHGKANIYKLAYDENFAGYAPGTLLTAMLFERAIDVDKVAEVDYLNGDDSYKKSWMDYRRERWGIVAYDLRSIGGLVRVTREVLGRALKRSYSLLIDPMGSDRTLEESTVSTTPINLNWQFMPADRFTSLSEKWQLLCDRSVSSPLLSADFFEIALRHFGNGTEVICIAEDKGEVIAAAILQRQNWLTWGTFQPSQIPLGSWLNMRKVDLATILHTLRRALPFPAMILGVTQLDTMFWSKPVGKTVLTLDSISTGEIDLPDTPDEFEQSINSKPFNRRMRKAEKEIGPITLITQTEMADVDTYVNLFASMESRGWKGAAGTALAPGDAQSKFYADLLRRFAGNGRARMFTLRMGSRDVAAQIAIAENGVLYLLKTTYEPDLRSFGPGVILHFFISMWCFQQETQIRRIEFYGPLNESQKMWVTGSRSIYHVNTYGTALAAKAHSYWMARRIRRMNIPVALEESSPRGTE